MWAFLSIFILSAGTVTAAGFDTRPHREELESRLLPGASG
jgi:hypothetical protein